MAKSKAGNGPGFKLNSRSNMITLVIVSVFTGCLGGFYGVLNMDEFMIGRYFIFGVLAGYLFLKLYYGVERKIGIRLLRAIVSSVIIGCMFIGFVLLAYIWRGYTYHISDRVPLSAFYQFLPFITMYGIPFSVLSGIFLTGFLHSLKKD